VFCLQLFEPGSYLVLLVLDCATPTRQWNYCPMWDVPPNRGLVAQCGMFPNVLCLVAVVGVAVGCIWQVMLVLLSAVSVAGDAVLLSAVSVAGDAVLLSAGFLRGGMSLLCAGVCGLCVRVAGLSVGVGCALCSTASGTSCPMWDVPPNRGLGAQCRAGCPRELSPTGLIAQ
jgi:hypothetical protein